MSEKCQRNLAKRKEDNEDTDMETQTAVSKANNRTRKEDRTTLNRCVS